MVGQELLQAGQYHSAVTVLESALRIGTCSLKLRGSVFSALSSAYWALNQLDKAIAYMQQDLAVAKSLGKCLNCVWICMNEEMLMVLTEKLFR